MSVLWVNSKRCLCVISTADMLVSGQRGLFYVAKITVVGSQPATVKENITERAIYIVQYGNDRLRIYTICLLIKSNTV